MSSGWLHAIARALLPEGLRSRTQKTIARLTCPIDFGTLRRVEPISRCFGHERGQVLDRYYIERFLRSWQPDIAGRVLEIGDARYTRAFGGNRVQISDVLHAQKGNPLATFVADLTDAPHVPSESFDCVICTQTLQYLFDVRSAVREIHRMLRPGGVVLGSVPGVAKVPNEDMAAWGDYWRFTRLSARHLLAQVFRDSDIVVEGFGNVLVAVAFLHGIAAEELTEPELDHHDDEYSIVLAFRARKAT